MDTGSLISQGSGLTWRPENEGETLVKVQNTDQKVEERMDMTYGADKEKQITRVTRSKPGQEEGNRTSLPWILWSPLRPRIVKEG